PPLRLELRLESVQALEVVEPRTVRPHPSQQRAEPERALTRINASVLGQRRKSERDVVEAICRQRAHRGIEQQLDGAVRRIVTAHELLDQPAAPNWSWRRDQKGHHLVLSPRDKDPAI